MASPSLIPAGLPRAQPSQAFCPAPLRPDRHILAGAEGVNRLPGANQLGASDDVEAVAQFFLEYRDQPATLRTYTKEVERLLLWSWQVRNKPLSSLDRSDFAAYSAFLADPQPRQMWCGPKRGRQGRRGEPGWRPFVGPLSPSGQRSALVIINTLMNYLTQALYLRANPLALMRRQKAQGGPLAMDEGERIASRAFDRDEWQAITDTLTSAPHTTHAVPELPDAKRTRFVVALLYFLALRVGELTTHTMGHFRQLRGLWFFFVVGKGQKPAQIPVCHALLDELRQWRRSAGLIALPHPAEQLPLVARADGQRALGSRRINQLIATLCECAATRLGHLPHKAEHLRAASAHWFHHTALTHQAQAGVALTHLKANARHSRIDTTLLYVHDEQDARHQQLQHHSWRGTLG